MNITAIIGLLAGVVIIGGVVWYSQNRMPAPSEGLQQEENIETETESVSTSGSGSLSAVFSRGGNFVCTFESVDPNAQSSGTVYISGNNIRGDFESTVAQAGGQTFSSYMLQTDGYVYTWSDASPVGVKSPTMAGEAGEAAASGSYDFDAGVSVDYNCQAWTPDQSKFSLPTGVQFMTPPTQ